MIEPADRRLSIRRQCALLGIPRSGVYYRPRPRIQRHTAHHGTIRAIAEAQPFYGYRKVALELHSREVDLTEKQVRRVMRALQDQGPASQAEHERQASPEPGLPVPAQGQGNPPSKPGVVYRPDLCQVAGDRLCVPRGDHGYLQPQGSVLARLQQHGHPILRGCPAGGPGYPRRTDDLQYRPRQPDNVKLFSHI
ncbi:MAG: IS3 family transposase [Bacillus subtilis]|nr:IS3 family transposase [Bacillus subtilis]